MALAALRRCRFTALLLAVLAAPVAVWATEPPPGILDFYATARDRAASPPDDQRLTVICQEQLPKTADGSDQPWVSFLGDEPGRVLLVAFTAKRLAAPADAITLRPRFNPGPTARSAGANATLDWAYVYDRNRDGLVDYVVYLQNAHAVLPDPLPPDLPKAKVSADGKISVGYRLLEEMLRRTEMVFRHYADDDFDGKVEAAVVEEFDPERPMFVKEFVVYRASQGGAEPAEAWAFRGDIHERRRVLTRGSEGWLVRSLTPPRPLASFMAAKSEMLGIINGAVSRCRLGAAALRGPEGR